MWIFFKFSRILFEFSRIFSKIWLCFIFFESLPYSPSGNLQILGKVLNKSSENFQGVTLGRNDSLTSDSSRNIASFIKICPEKKLKHTFVSAVFMNGEHIPVYTGHIILGNLPRLHKYLTKWTLSPLRIRKKSRDINIRIIQRILRHILFKEFSYYIV